MQFSRTNRKLLRVRFNEITPLGSSTNVRNRAESIYPPDLGPLVYDRLQYLSMFESLDSVSEETKKNIQAVRKLYLSKALVPNKGHTMYFRKGQPITGWFDEIKGFPAEALDALYAEPQVQYFAEQVSLIYRINYSCFLISKLDLRHPLQMASKMVVYPTNREEQHNVCISLLLSFFSSQVPKSLFFPLCFLDSPLRSSA